MGHLVWWVGFRGLHFGLEEGYGGSGGVGEDGGPAYVGDLHGTFVDGGSEGLGFVGGGVDVVYADVGEPHGGDSRHGEDAAAGAGVGLEGGIDHVVAHVVVGVGPAEEAGVEVFGFGGVGGREFEVHEGVCHRVSFRGWVDGELVGEEGFEELSFEVEGLLERE